MPKGKTKHYFPGGNTCLGYYSLWDSNINSLGKLLILKGGPGTGKSVMMNSIAQELLKDGWAAELLMCSSDANSLDGIVFREMGVGLADGYAPHTRDPLYPGIVDKIINLGDYWDEHLLQRNRKIIIELTDKHRALYVSTYHHLAEAKRYHDKLEALYIEGMDWSGVNSLTENVLSELFSGYDISGKGREVHRFAGASTPQGSVNYLDELLADAKRRIILKGRAGTGKSTFTRKVAAAACQRGFDTEYYHCSFDPHSIDNILIPELGICVIDGTPPHEKTPGPGDTVVDMLGFMSDSVYKKNEEQILETDALYMAEFNKAFNILQECKDVHDKLEEYYSQAMDFKAVDRLTATLLSEIREYARAREHESQ